MDKVNADYCYYFLPNSHMFKLLSFLWIFLFVCTRRFDMLVDERLPKYSSHN